MSYAGLVGVHLGLVVPAFVLGSWLLVAGKGTGVHKGLGRVYILLMLAVAVSALFIPAQVGPALFGHLGFIHLFSAVVLVALPRAFLAVRRGDIRVHRRAMHGVYFGGLVLAGAFAFFPGRLLYGWLGGVVGGG